MKLNSKPNFYTFFRVLEYMKNIKSQHKPYCQFLTPRSIFYKYIYPNIKDQIKDYVWVDMFCGHGDLITPIIESLPPFQQEYFTKHSIRLFDIDVIMLERAIKMIDSLSVNPEVAKNVVFYNDSFKKFPIDKIGCDIKQIYHITNPPYTYIGNIIKKPELQELKQYFKGDNSELQDLYQIAMNNDMKNGIKQMAYVIPANFLFGDASVRKFRVKFLTHYTITRCYIFEKIVFKDTMTNVGLFFFKEKILKLPAPCIFPLTRVGETELTVNYKILPKNHYRGGSLYYDFIEKYSLPITLDYHTYITEKMLIQHAGTIEVKMINANSFNRRSMRYTLTIKKIDEHLYNIISKNILYLTLIDGVNGKKAKMGIIGDDYGADGIYCVSDTRTQPIPIIFEPPEPTIAEQRGICRYFNTALEYLRIIDNSEFLSTFRETSKRGIRKYVSLNHVRQILSTYPICIMNPINRATLTIMATTKRPTSLIKYITEFIHDWKSKEAQENE